MSFGSSHDTKEQVRQATDIVDVVGRSIRLRRQGRNYVGLCPWHDDRNPSLQVNPERQSWKCWVCDIGGDVFSFVMKREGVDFPESLRILADQAGIPLAAPGFKKAKPGSPDDKKTLYEAVRWAEEQFHQCLMTAAEADPARTYLRDRGITQNSAKKFHLGYSPDSWQWLVDRAKTTPFSPAILDAAGLVSKTQDGSRFYDRFRGRLLFSIRDTEHRPIAFGARILPRTDRAEDTPGDPSRRDDGPKYVNTPETRLFSKSNHLYALDVVRETLARNERIVVVEGYTDVIMAHQMGLTNVVAALGTALGERHVRLLRRFADQITLVLDGDEAGQRRTNEILELFVAAEVDLRVLTLPAGLDPCDFVQEKGADEFRHLLDEAVDALEHKFRIATDGIDLTGNPDQAHRAMESILNTMAAAPRLTATSSESLRLREQQMLARLARLFRVEETTVRARLRELRQRFRRTRKTGPGPEEVTSRSKMTPEETELFEILVWDGELAAVALQAITPQQLTSPLARELWQLYVAAGESGIDCEFERILTLAEDADLKSTLVSLDENARAKAEDAMEGTAERLEGLLRNFEIQKEKAAAREATATLENGGFDPQEEIDVLDRMIQQERGRQGF